MYLRRFDESTTHKQGPFGTFTVPVLPFLWSSLAPSAVDRTDGYASQQGRFPGTIGGIYVVQYSTFTMSPQSSLSPVVRWRLNMCVPSG